LISTSTSPLSSRVATGNERLDGVLQGGFVEASAVVLCAPPGDEILALVGSFLTQSQGDKSLFICRGLSSVRSVSTFHSKDLVFLVCGERVTQPVEGVLAGKGLDNLTELSLDMSDALSKTQPRRVVIDIVSDLLLRHGPLQTRKWMSEQLSRVRSKGITTLAILNPTMHSQAEISAVVDLFDGNLEAMEKEVGGQPKKFVRVRWMHGITITETEPVPLVSPTVTKRETRTATNLPQPVTTLLGREKELDNAWPLLLRDEVRVLTLTGPGGTGKTALGLEVARSLVSSFSDGVFFVPLAPIFEPKFVVPTIAGILGVKEEGSVTILESLKNFLRDKQILLVLDNFEQVVKAGPQMADLLTACPRLKLLVTSREALHIREEREFPVPPLTLPDLKRLPGAEALAANAAVSLFVERAHAAKPDFELTNENARSVAEICYRLDGLPLALELAAARVKILTPQALLRRLESRLGILTGGAKDLPSRQQTLRNAIAWSHDMLDNELKKLFMWLSVFLGGFNVEAAEAVCESAGGMHTSALDGLSALVERSLLRQEVIGEEPRFSFLETIREFSIECLKSSGDSDRLRRAHADFYLTLSEKEPELRGTGQAELLNRLDREHDNLRGALRWSLEVGETELGLRFAASLWRFWFVRGYVAEGRDWIQKLLSISTKRTEARANSLLGAGSLANFHGDVTAARAYYEESLSINRELGKTAGEAVALYYIADLAQDQGDYDNAEKLAQESLRMTTEVGDKRRISYALGLLGEIAIAKGDFGEARSFFLKSLEMSRQLGEKLEISMSLGYLGDIACRLDDFQNALKYSEESLSLSREVGDKEGIAMALSSMGSLARRKGEFQRARTLLTDSLKIFIETSEKERIAHTLEQLGGVDVDESQMEEAALLFAAAEALRETMKVPMAPVDRPQYDKDLALVRSTLAGERLTSAWTRGRTTTLEELAVINPKGE